MSEEVARIAALEALPQIDSNETSSLPMRVPKARPLRPAIYPLHPIIHSSGTSPMSSPTMSRRSSSAGSAVSSVGNKSVRFPEGDKDLTSYRYTFSREHYDRSPIIPSCEDLEIPSCKSVESGSWLTCLQKKAKEAVLAGQPPPFISSVFSGGELNHPSPTSTISTNPPSLVHEDWSSSSESDDHLSPATFTPPPSQIFGDSCNIQSLTSEALCQSLMASEPRTFSWDTFRSSSESYDDDAEEDDVEESETIRRKRDRSPSEHDEDEEDDDDDRPARMCSLGGKFSRSELYSEPDCLGGF